MILESELKTRVTGPSAGGTGSRCEKGLTNGSYRERSSNACTNKSDCCGSATGWVDGSLMTIETCQPRYTTKYKYTPPAHLGDAYIKEPQMWDFRCILGST